MNTVILPIEPLPFKKELEEYKCLKYTGTEGDMYKLRSKVPGKRTVKNNIRLIPDIDLKQSYVLSHNFFSNEIDGLTHLEIQLNNYIDYNPVDPVIVEELILDWDNWGVLEQFYLTPILFVLMKAAVRELK